MSHTKARRVYDGGRLNTQVSGICGFCGRGQSSTVAMASLSGFTPPKYLAASPETMLSPGTPFGVV